LAGWATSVEAKGEAEPRGQSLLAGHGVHDEFWPVLEEKVMKEQGVHELLAGDGPRRLKVPGGQETHCELSGDEKAPAPQGVQY